MGEAAKSAASIYSELGPLAFLLVVGALAFAYLVWRIVIAQDKISDTLDRVNGVLSSHDQRASDMHATCREHSTQLDKISETLGEHTAKIQVLQEIVRR